MSSRNRGFLTSVLLYLGLLAAINTQQVSAINCNATYSTEPAAYPNQAQICTVFSNLLGTDHNYKAFFQTVADNVNWTIEGTHPLAGQYNNKTILEIAFVRIDSTAAKATPFLFSLTNIIGGGNDEWSLQELEVRGTCTSGLQFDNRYAWATRWSPQGVILQARAYLDSALVAAAIVANELGPFTYIDPRDSITPFVTLSAKALNGTTGFQSS